MSDDDFLDVFLEELGENVQTLNKSMMDYERERSEEALDEMFRATHTIKSSAASMGFDELSELSHKMEDVFDALRDDEIEADNQVFNLLYSGIDTLEEFLHEARKTGDAPDVDASDTIAKLEKVKKGEEIEDTSKDLDFEAGSDVQDIKVESEILDNLLNSVGELMIIEKKLRDELEPFEDESVERAMKQFQRLGESIRQELTHARMVPVSQVFERFPRTVRDLSQKTEKEVVLDISGEDLRLDRTVLDEIDEPILHMIRNAIDHGIEDPKTRVENGKPATGRIELRARRQGDKAVITVEDDGRGVDTEEIVQSAIENDIITSQEAQNMDRDEKLELMFDPNLSTTEDVTELSGRGVGMSTVKKTVEKLQGKYNIESEPGEGTKIELRLPISLAIVKCFIIESGGKTFGIPINGIEHVKRITNDEVQTIEGREVFRYDDQELPLVDLSERFSDDESEVNEDGDFPLIIVYIGKRRAGLKVDEIKDTEEFVIKDIDFIEQENIAGSSVLPDGTPIPILDTSHILN